MSEGPTMRSAGEGRRSRRRLQVCHGFGALIAVAVVGCSGSGDDDAPGNFDERLQEGAPCSELFDIRNELDPDSEFIPLMNEDLRAIGCFGSDSERTD